MLKPIRVLTLPQGSPLTHYRLENGLDLYVIENHSAPVFHIQTWFRVGSKDESLDPGLRCTGLAHLFEHMMFRGTTRHPDGQFDEILTRSGVQDQNATTWLDRTNYFQSLPTSKLELVLELESDRMAHLKIDRDLLETEKGAVLGEYHMCQDDPMTVAYEKLYGTGFEVHPYRFSTIGTEAEIQGFSVESANYFYRKYYAPNNASIFVVGDVKPETVAALVHKHYGAYPSQKIERLTAPTEPPQRNEKRVEFEHAQLTEPKLLVGYHTPGIQHPDHAALWVLEGILTAGLGSRLQEAWVDAGITVGVNGGLDQFHDPGLLVLDADLQPGRDPNEAVAALDEVLKKLDQLDLAAETERSRNLLLLGTYQAWDENEGLANFMGESLASTGDPFFGFNQLNLVAQVTPQRVLEVARKYLVPASRTLVVGKAAS